MFLLSPLIRASGVYDLDGEEEQEKEERSFVRSACRQQKTNNETFSQGQGGLGENWGKGQGTFSERSSFSGLDGICFLTFLISLLYYLPFFFPFYFGLLLMVFFTRMGAGLLHLLSLLRMNRARALAWSLSNVDRNKKDKTEQTGEQPDSSFFGSTHGEFGGIFRWLGGK